METVRGQPSSLDVKEIWFSNMHLLGFKHFHRDDIYKVSFEKDMFVHINKRGSEVVLHHLFCKLDSHYAYENFR